jgi:hypothetical protein
MAPISIREVQQAAISHALRTGGLPLGIVIDVTLETRRQGAILIVGLEERLDVQAP